MASPRPLRWLLRRIRDATLLLLLTFYAAPALAQRNDTALFLEAVVNGVGTSLIVAATQTGSTLRINRAELAEVGIETRDLPDGEIDLDTVTGLAWRYDLPSQRLFLDANPARLAPRRLSLARSPPEDAQPSRGAALNYDLNLRAGSSQGRGFGLEAATLGIDAWAFWRNARLSTSGLLLMDLRGDRRVKWRRYDSALTVDVPRHALTLTLGDSVTAPPGWGRPIRFGGLHIARDFGLRRDISTTPLLSFEGSAAVPSTVDVFVEGDRIYSAANVLGRFRIEDIPIVTGAGTAEVTLRGDDGSQRRLRLPFYGTPNLLRAGVTDWSLSIGYPRFEFGIENANYGDAPVFDAALRRGLTDRVTLAAQASGGRDFWHIAAGGQFIAGRAAEVGLTYGQSRHADKRGHFHEVTLSARPFGRLRLNASHYRASAEYTDLASYVDAIYGSHPAPPDRARDVINISLPARAGGIGIGLSHIRIRRADRRADQTSLGISRPLRALGPSALLSLSGTHDWRRKETRASVWLSMRLGKASLQTTASNHDGQRVALMRPDDGQQGSWGYAVDASLRDSSVNASARIWKNHRTGRAELSARSFRGRDTVSVRMQGAFALLDRRITAGRRITGSFAVVDLGRAGLPVRHQNRVVGTTGPGGRLLVPSLAAYARNRLSIDVTDLPADAGWSVSASEVTPARRAGVHVPLLLDDAAQQRVVRLTNAAGQPLPAGTPLTLDGAPYDLVIGYDGLLLVQGAAAGAVIDTGSCRAALPPGDSGPHPATVTCR